VNSALQLPLLQSADRARPVLWSRGRAVSVAEFLHSAATLASRLPEQKYLLNLCEHRHEFLVAFCAALLRRQTNLLPSSRAQTVVDEVLAAYDGAYVCDDSMVVLADAPSNRRSPDAADAAVPLAQVAAVAFTSGSTGQPQRHAKLWGSFQKSNAFNVARIHDCLEPRHGKAQPSIVATVPPQHMYGIETSVLLPLIGDMAVHAGRPLFPADVAAALGEVPAPRILVTTPIHLRALLNSSQRLPDVALVISATAPLDADVAIAVEKSWGTRLLEMFGSTETCVIATRETARDTGWRLFAHVSLEPLANGTTVDAPWFETPVVLQDILDPLPDGHFIVRGRNADMVEVAGKRASLLDLTRRLQNLPGVRDAVVFQPDIEAAGVVRRVAALAVAPEKTAEELCRQLACSIDAAFIPRPLVLVSSLPRNEVGKLPRDRLLAALRTPAGN
jgi:acyl-coenzyme A synthetase/AMP-(fatty) acid ligase